MALANENASAHGICDLNLICMAFKRAVASLPDQRLCGIYEYLLIHI